MGQLEGAYRRRITTKRDSLLRSVEAAEAHLDKLWQASRVPQDHTLLAEIDRRLTTAREHARHLELCVEDILEAWREKTKGTRRG